jgi:hypothetical protein
MREPAYSPTPQRSLFELKDLAHSAVSWRVRAPLRSIAVYDRCNVASAARTDAARRIAASSVSFVVRV